MAKTRKSVDKKVNFNHMDISKKETKYLPDLLSQIYSDFTNKKYRSIPELTIDGTRLYLSGIQRTELGDEIIQMDNIPTSFTRYAYAINISRVNPGEQLLYGDLDRPIDERNGIINKALLVDETDEADSDATEAGDSKDVQNLKIGPLSDTQFIIDPYRRVVGSMRGTGRLNLYYLKKFLEKLCDIKSVSFSFILNQQGLDDIKNLTGSTQIRYSVVSPDKFKTFEKDNRSENKDFAIARYFKGDNFTITIGSNKKMSKAKIIAKVKSLLNIGEKAQVKTLKVEGFGDDGPEQVDLIKNKLSRVDKLEYVDAPTSKDVIDLLIGAYKFVYDDYIEDNYDADVRPQKGDVDEKGKNTKE